jgi:hypothetical protein
MRSPTKTGAAPGSERCAALAERLAEPLAGTAPVATGWLCLEQPGPWGRDALRQSHLDPAVGAELSRRVEGTGVRIALIRRPEGHPDTHLPHPRRVYLAGTAPGPGRSGPGLPAAGPPVDGWLEEATVGDPKELLTLDFAAIGGGRPPGFGTRRTAPVLLVCTNGRRDLCCALLGRPLAAALAARHGDAVWESTHTGGHRFAPTGVVLPAGYAYGRLDLAAAEAVLGAAAAGEMVPAGCRGRSRWTRPQQVAELAVREATGERGLADVVPVAAEAAPDGGWLVPVRHSDGRRWLARVVERALAPPRPESCGKEPGTPTALTVAELAPA